MSLTDGQLVRRVREGDREAFGELVDRYRDMVYGLAYHLIGEFEAARDLAQEAFIQAYLRLAQLRDPKKFCGWLRQIALNVRRSQLRRREVATVALEAEAQPSPPNPQPSEIEVVVREALAKLRAPERLALTLHYINGYSHGEIGRFLGVRPETVKTRLARARQHLREEVMSMVKDTFESRKLPEEFTKETMGKLLRRLASLEDPFSVATLRQLAADSRGSQVGEVAEGLAALMGEGESLWRAMFLTGSLSPGATCFARFAQITGRRDGLGVAADLLRSGLLRPDSPVSPEEVAGFCAYLSCILQAGIPLFQAIEMAGRHTPSLSDLAASMVSGLRTRNTMAEAFAEHTSVFTESFVAAIRLFGTSGTFDAGLATLAALLWEPSLLDTNRIAGDWGKKMKRAREIRDAQAASKGKK